jgi:hypothetical protein
VNPALASPSGNLNPDERLVGPAVYAVVSLPDNGPEDLLGDDEHKRCRRQPEHLLHRLGIEQPERDVEGLAEEALAVVVNLPGVNDGA